ncbi:sporulation protein YpjB [Virgibacillus sp. FSP13]
MKHLLVRFIFVLLILGVFIFPLYTINAYSSPPFATATNAETTGDMTPLYWMIAIVGGLIAVTLTYVSWRKYKGEVKKRSKKGPNS